VTLQQIVGWSCIALLPLPAACWAYCILGLLEMNDDLEEEQP